MKHSWTAGPSHLASPLDMGIDRGLAKAFGYLTIGVVLVSSTTTMLLAFLTGNRDILLMFGPAIAAYSGMLALTAIGIAVYVFLRRRRDDPA